MADNITLDSGSGGDTLGADDISSVKYQRVKLIHGADGSNDGDVATANPLPVDLREVAGSSVSAGAGAVAAGTQRVTLASDDPAVVDLAALEVLLQKTLRGPTPPTSFDSYTHAVIDETGSDSVLVASGGAGTQIWVYGCVLSNAGSAGTIVFQDEDDTALSGTIGIAANGIFTVSPSGNFMQPWFKVATNKALEVDCSTATLDGTITYSIVTV